MRKYILIIASFFVLGCAKDGGLAPGETVATPTTSPTPTTPVFTPNQITSIHSWFDASDAATISLNGSSVTAWRDKNNNAFQFVQSSAALQPIIQSNAVNGKSAVRFDGTNDVLTAILGSNIGADVTFSYVVQTSSFNNVIPFSFSSNTHTNGPDVYFSSSRLSWNTGDGVGNPFTNSIYPTINVPHLITVKNNSILNKTDLYVDGVYVGVAGYRSTTTTNLSSPRLFIGNWTNGNYFLNGYFAELIIYNKVLDEAERADLEFYLKTKWGTP